MNCKEIRDAALNGKTFTIKNVPIESIEFGDIQSCIDGLGHPVLFKTVNIKFVSPDIIDSVYSDNNDYPNIEVCEKPKYDPARLFKKGDIVKPCSVNGRWCSHVWEDRSGIHYEVAKDEDPLTAHMEVKDPDSPQPFLVHAAFFKLVIPVEELKPYSIIVQPEDYHCVRIMKGTKIHSSIPFDEEECVCRTVEEAKAAAEEECDRLNAEYRKEQK